MECIFRRCGSKHASLLVVVPFCTQSRTSTTMASSGTPQKKENAYSKLANMYKPGRFTSKSLPKGPMPSNQPWDPVFANYVFHRRTGPLQRKQNTTPDDHLTIDEAEKWMDARGAAKVLGIKEEDLPHLTSAQIEERWVKVYGERSNALQQETVIAVEVLLEYIDSSLRRKKSRQYYRQYIDNARQSIDHETELRRRDHRQKFIYMFGSTMFIGCSIVIAVAFFRDFVTRKDLENIGSNAKAYLNMTLTQPKNLEPPPDYATRYRETPTAMDLDLKAGTFGLPPAETTGAEIASEMEDYRRREEEEMLRLFNDENDRAKREAKEKLMRESRVRVYRHDDFDEKGELKETNEVTYDPGAAFSQMSFRQFSKLMASQFGGGSRFQRITQDSVQRTEELNKIRSRTENSLH